MNGPADPSNGGSQSENTVLKRVPHAELPGAVGAGTVLSERYRLIGTPEVGQVATVYRAETIETGKAVAVQIFHEVGRNDRKRIELLRRPIARGRGLLDLPSVFVAAYECALTDDGRLFLVTELVDDPSVADLLRQGPLTPLRALGLAMRIGEALEVARNPGFLDLRVAPQDIAVAKDEDRVKLRRSDVPILGRLGLADQLAAAEAPWRDPRYAPPEELAGFPPTEAGVVYQFGLLLYELLCGSTPFDGATPAQVHERKLRPLRIQLRTRHRALPASVERLVSRMLHPDPRTRPVDLTLVLNELWDVLCHVRTKMPATSIDSASSVTSRGSVRPIPRPWTPHWALAGLAALVVAGALLAWPQLVNAPRAPGRSAVEMAQPPAASGTAPSVIAPPRDIAGGQTSTEGSGSRPPADLLAPDATQPAPVLPPTGGTTGPVASKPPSVARPDAAEPAAGPKVVAPAAPPIAEPSRTLVTGTAPATPRAAPDAEPKTTPGEVGSTPPSQPETPVSPPPARPTQPPPDNPRAADPGAIIEWLVREGPRPGE